MSCEEEPGSFPYVENSEVAGNFAVWIVAMAFDVTADLQVGEVF